MNALRQASVPIKGQRVCLQNMSVLLDFKRGVIFARVGSDGSCAQSRREVLGREESLVPIHANMLSAQCPSLPPYHVVPFALLLSVFLRPKKILNLTSCVVARLNSI